MKWCSDPFRDELCPLTRRVCCKVCDRKLTCSAGCEQQPKDCLELRRVPRKLIKRHG